MDFPLPCYHRENGGTLGMVPLIINPIHTLYTVILYTGYLLGISPFKGLLGGLNSKGTRNFPLMLVFRVFFSMKFRFFDGFPPGEAEFFTTVVPSTQGAGWCEKNISLREPQHTPGAYPRHPQTPKWKEFLHKVFVQGVGYVPGVCWKSLRISLR